jgi:hypothetical protein
VHIRIETLVVGLCLTSLGALWVLGNLGRIDVLSVLHTWWPLSLLVWGLLEIVFSFGRGSRP